MDYRRAGISAALGAALLFGIGTPLAKLLLGHTSPLLLAGLLYLGSGLGLGLVRLCRGSVGVQIVGNDIGWLIGAIVAGGILAPVLLMWGLGHMPASGAALLLNAEGVFTALIAWFVFRENFDRRIALGMTMIVAGAAVLSWSSEGTEFSAKLPALSVLGACLAWAIDNNLTRKISLSDATFIAMLKGLTAGVVNLALALAIGASMPPLSTAAGAAVVGFVSYGLSLALFVVALRHLGTARTVAYFSIAPFAGALLAIPLMGEEATSTLILAGALMGCGVWLHLTERHEHGHTHETMEHEHEHEHEHDLHHQHAHDYPIAPGTRHSHRHRHEPITHGHPHYPDAHHLHEH